MTSIGSSYFDLPPEAIVALSPRELFHIVGNEVGERWHHLADAAERNGKVRKGGKTLIVVCAQHPLANGIRPNKEFVARLQRAVELGCAQVGPVVMYVPGSIHHPDKVSLSSAGVGWLTGRGVEAELHGDDANEQYKGAHSPAAHKGVYGCCDEAYVASRIVYDDNSIGKVCLIASVNQRLRMELHLLANGIAPSQVISVAPCDSYHTPEAEKITNLPSVLLARDPTFQAPDEIMPLLIRRARVPGLTAQ